MYEDLVRKAGIVIKPQLTPAEQQIVDYWTEAFGGDTWKQIAREAFDVTINHRFLVEVLDGVPLDDMPDETLLSPDEIQQLKELKFMGAYRDLLAKTDSKLTIKLVDLLYPDKERTMFYLYLTTHDPSGALSLNKVLFDAKLLEGNLRSRLKAQRAHPGQLTLFDAPSANTNDQSRPTPDQAADLVWQRCKGKTITRRDVYREMAGSLLFATEVDSALRRLRRTERATFDGDLKHSTVIEFCSK